MSSHSQASSSRQGRRRGSTTTQQKPSSSHEQLADQMQQQLKVTEQAQALPVVEQNTVIETKKMHSRKNQYGRWINNYLILNQLGKGQHGDVWLAREPVSKRYVVRALITIALQRTLLANILTRRLSRWSNERTQRPIVCSSLGSNMVYPKRPTPSCQTG